MANADYDSAARLNQAEEAVKQAADRLDGILAELAGQLDPFPYFLGSIEVRGVEAEPGGANKADRGCIVVCQDGKLYEFSMKIQAPDDFDLGMERDDSINPVDMPSEDYIAYAYHAIKEITTLIDEQRSRAQKYSF